MLSYGLQLTRVTKLFTDTLQVCQKAMTDR